MRFCAIPIIRALICIHSGEFLSMSKSIANATVIAGVLMLISNVASAQQSLQSMQAPGHDHADVGGA